MIFQDVALLTESELARVLGVPVKDLRIKGKDFINLQCQEENASLRVLPMSLLGMPADIAQGVRKIRLYHSSSVEGTEHLLQMENQLAAEAPGNWLNHATKNHVDSRPRQFQACNRHNLHSWVILQKAADDILNGRESEDEADEPQKDDNQAPPAAGEGDEDGFFSDDEGKVAPKPVAMPTAGLGSFGRAAAEEPAKKAAAKTRIRRKRGEVEAPAAEAEEDILDIGAGEAGSFDDDMEAVHSKHVELGYPPAPCLQRLRVERFFVCKSSGDKMGNVLNGVQASAIRPNVSVSVLGRAVK